MIQVSTHFFIEASVLELFGNAMMFGWYVLIQVLVKTCSSVHFDARLSANNCARVYNSSLSAVDACMQNNIAAYGGGKMAPQRKWEWPYALELQAEEAMNGFFLYSLLLDRAEHQSHLVLSHDAASQKDRLAEAMRLRNEAMEGVGQEEWAHACDLCFIVKEDADGQPGMASYANILCTNLSHIPKSNCSSQSAMAFQ